jgi:regulatory protein YycH of two-component signal transduction system YycFG
MLFEAFSETLTGNKSVVKMSSERKRKIDYIVACVNEFSKSTGLTAQESFRYLSNHGGLDFLLEHYEAEHTLSFEEMVEDMKNVSRRSGGKIA